MLPRALVLATALAALLAAAPAHALCSGATLLDRLTPAQTAALATATAATPFAEGRLWQARRGDTTLTLIGTLHLADPRHQPLIETVSPLIAAADLVLLEMTPQEEAAMQAALATDPSLMFRTDGPTLPERLDEATWAAVAEAARARNIPPFIASRFQPWFLMLTFSVPPCAMPDMMSGGPGLDQLLMREAEAAGVPMAALEPWDTIFELFAQSDIDSPIALLHLTLLDPDLQSEMLVAMRDSYFAGRIAETWELSRLSLNFLPDLSAAEGAALFALTEEALLTTRNAAWIRVIDTAAAAHDSIVLAAGAAHLPGQQGLLTLLQSDGWSITRLD